MTAEMPSSRGALSVHSDVQLHIVGISRFPDAQLRIRGLVLTHRPRMTNLDLFVAWRNNFGALQHQMHPRIHAHEFAGHVARRRRRQEAHQLRDIVGR